jgi:hypothetical protein
MLQVRTTPTAAVLLLSLAAASGLLAQHDQPQPSVSAETALVRFLARPDEPVRSYRALRSFRAEGLGKRAEMEVLVELDGDRGFRWTVLSEEGARVFLDKGFLGMLRKEQEAYASGQAGRASLTGLNYELEADGRGPDGLVRLRVHPRRKEVALLDGHILVSPETADIVRVEGRLAKGPSFWVPRVDVVRHYARLRGHRVLMRIESVAQVRLFGEVRTVVDTTYQAIDGEEIRPPWWPVASVVAAHPDPARLENGQPR